jgi:hypothetical protein
MPITQTNQSIFEVGNSVKIDCDRERELRKKLRIESLMLRKKRMMTVFLDATESL